MTPRPSRYVQPPGSLARRYSCHGSPWITYQAPRLGTDARCEPCRSTLGTERRRKRVPFTEAPMPEWMWFEGVDMPPAAPDCGACAPDPNRRQHREGASGRRSWFGERLPPISHLSPRTEHLSR
jgi:hypothetical protein